MIIRRTALISLLIAHTIFGSDLKVARGQDLPSDRLMFADATPTLLIDDTELPSRYARAETLVFRRQRVDNRSFAFRSDNNARVLRTDQWGDPFTVGGRFTLGQRLGLQDALEASGWWTNFDDQTSYAAPSGTFRQPFFNHSLYSPSPMIGGMPALVELAYQSQIRDVEISWRHFLSPEGSRPLRLGFLVGPRYFALEEQFQDYDNRTAVRGAHPSDSVYRTWVSNNLYGGQLGALFDWRPNIRWTTTADARFGGFYNQTDASNELALQNGSITWFRSSTPEQRFSGVAEARFSACWRPCQWLELWAGYSAIYFWNMTSAPDVLSFNLQIQSKQNNELAFWVHGPTAGIQLRF